MRWSIAFLVLILPTIPVSALVIHVPGDEPSIQAGLDAAAYGDTVLLACGLYEEHDIEMKAGVCLRGASGDPGCVIINAEYFGRGIKCDNLGAHAVIEGLTVQHGYAGMPQHEFSSGGGIYCFESSPTIRSCRIVNCSAALSAGGIYCGLDSSPLIVDCRIEANDAVYTGGGMRIISSFPTFIDCDFTANSSGDAGGGIAFYSSSADFIGCTFSYNSSNHGGAFDVDNQAEARFSGCTFVWNSARNGGAILTGGEAVVAMENCIIAFSRDSEGVACEFDALDPILSCCDIFGNDEGDWIDCVADQETENGNLAADPRFCGLFGSEDFTLNAESACAAENSGGCGLIGARPVTCGDQANRPMSWSAVKSLY